MNDKLISDRVQSLDVSGIRKVFDLAQKLKDPINFSIGQPDFMTPEPIKQSASDAIMNNLNSYTPTQGRADLIEALTSDAKERQCQFEDLIVTSGVSGGLLLAFSALLNPGDELLITDPYFLMYKQLGNFLGANIKYAKTYPHFKSTAAALEPHITDKTKLLVLNNPGNPTGVSLTQDEWKDLVDLLNRFPDLIVISDEIYRMFYYEDTFISLAQLRDNVITLDGFSKSHSLTGWRVGWAHGPKAIIQQMAKLQQFTFVCAPSIAQKACLDAMELKMEEEVQAYTQKRDLIYNLLKDNFEVAKPDGTFYIFPKVPEKYTNGQAFVEACLDNNVLLIPGNVFSEQDTHFRISFATSDEKIKEGAKILNGLV